MNDEKYQQVIRAIKDKAKKILPPGSKVTLYGSRARGDARSDSDWDIHVLIPGPEKLPLSVVSDYAMPFDELGLDLNEFINTRVYSFGGWLRRSFLPFYKNVSRDGILIFQN